jgi:hypothetical protein
VRRTIGDGTMLYAGRDDENVTGLEGDGFLVLYLDTEGPVPTQEELVFLVVMPRELTVEPGNPNHGVVDANSVDRLPRSGQAGDQIRD